jgi:hypothetical protein
MRIDVNFCFAIDLVTAGAAGHEYPKQRLQNNGHRICLIKLDKNQFLTKSPKNQISMRVTFSLFVATLALAVSSEPLNVGVRITPTSRTTSLTVTGLSNSSTSNISGP